MSDQSDQGLLALLEAFTASGQANAEVTGKITDELMRLRAWEAILYVFFTRYYLGKENPTAAAAADRNFIADSHRKHGGTEEGAQQVEDIYQTLTMLIETYQRHEAKSAQDEVASPPEYTN